MKTSARAASGITAAVILTLAAGCGGTHPSETACKQAMKTGFASAIAAGQTAQPAATPPACNGLDNNTLMRLAGEVINETLYPSPGAS
jgi:hypothetical protein